MSLYYDRQGNEITAAQWVKIFADTSQREVARDVVGGYTVLTAWYGMDPYDRGGPEGPHIFETRAWETKTNRALDWMGQGRWSTEQLAREGHRAWVDLLFTHVMTVDTLV